MDKEVLVVNDSFDINEIKCPSYDNETGICYQTGKVCDFCEDV